MSPSNPYDYTPLPISADRQCLPVRPRSERSDEDPNVGSGTRRRQENEWQDYLSGYEGFDA